MTTNKAMMVVLMVASCGRSSTEEDVGQRPVGDAAVDTDVAPVEPVCDRDLSRVRFVGYNYWEPEGSVIDDDGYLLFITEVLPVLVVGLTGLAERRPEGVERWDAAYYDFWDLEGVLSTPTGERIWYSERRDVRLPGGQEVEQINPIDGFGNFETLRTGLMMRPRDATLYGCSCDPIYTLELEATSLANPACRVAGRWERLRVVGGTVEDPYFVDTQWSAPGCRQLSAEGDPVPLPEPPDGYCSDYRRAPPWVEDPPPPYP